MAGASASGLSSAVLAFMALNFLFVDPLYPFQVTDLADLIRLTQFLVVAALTGFLAGRLREEAAAAQARARVVTALSGLTQGSAELPGLNRPGQATVLAALVRALADLAGPPSAVIGADGQVLAREGAAPGPAELAAAERALRRGRVEDAIAPGWDGTRMVFQPLAGGALAARHAPVDRRRRDAGLIDAALALARAQGAGGAGDDADGGCGAVAGRGGRLAGGAAVLGQP